MKTSVRKRSDERGQAILLVVLGMSIFLLGAVGLAIDGSHLYAQRQMAQAAADAAAEAGIMSIFDGTSGAGTHAFTASATVTTCTPTSDQKTPCYYAQTRNGFNGASDVVTFDVPTAAAVGVNTSSLSTSDPVNLLRVTVQRPVNTTLIRFLGPSTSTIRATGTAAIVGVLSPVPIIVTHPSMSGALSSNGNPTINICGGPSRSIQVNSNSSTSLSMNSNTTIDLHHAGPDPLNTCSGPGADFGDWGGPGTYPFTFISGTGHYVQPASPILDPLSGVSPPPIPSAAPAKTALADGVSGCPTSPIKACKLYSPGLYSSGIDVQNETAIFKPGIYYVTSGGFGGSANAYMAMATGFTDTGAGTTGTGWTGNMLVYNTGGGNNDVFSIGANGTANLVGSPDASVYKGILLFEDRAAAAHTGSHAHKLGGGGAMTLIGTVYITNTLSVMQANASQYQEVALQGTPGSSTNIQGEIIASALSLGGNAGITMTLSSLPSLTVRQVALVH